MKAKVLFPEGRTFPKLGTILWSICLEKVGLLKIIEILFFKRANRNDQFGKKGSDIHTLILIFKFYK
jgi:hypothetical protein